MSAIPKFDVAIFRLPLADRVNLARLLVPEMDVEPGWQPIATAPCNGTLVLLFGLDEAQEQLVAYYDDSADAEGYSHPWHTLDGQTAYGREAFTHWRPLPAPPAGQEPGQ